MSLVDLYGVSELVIVASESGGHGGANLIAQIGNVILGFLIVFFILKRYAWGRILAIIDERREKIESDLERAEKLQQQAESDKKELDDRLANIEEESRAKMQELIGEGQRIAQKIQDEARDQATQMIEKAQQNIQLETEKARVALKEEIINLTISATEQLIKERLDDEKHKQLIGDFLNRIERN